ncbi:MAG: class I SAM-dependent methyltransferase [Rhodobacteraceae bacterium]|nr:class I SAM-dependent methyltransferase [Paracoccaceae bacterium]
MPVKYDEYYSAQNHALGSAFKDATAFFQNLEVGQTMLDVGVGQGRDAIPLAQMGHRVIGIDLSSIGIEPLKNAAASQHFNIDTEVAELSTNSPTERLDIIIFDRTLHMITNTIERENAFSRYLDFIQPQGQIVLIDACKNMADFHACMDKHVHKWSISYVKRTFLIALKEA